MPPIGSVVSHTLFSCFRFLSAPRSLSPPSTHPFYLQTLAESGSAHGVFVRSSNGMDVVVSTQKVTFKIIGGILEWYVFVGPTHEQVLQQYHGVIGLPHFPPYWSLGWHQCKVRARMGLARSGQRCARGVQQSTG